MNLFLELTEVIKNWMLQKFDYLKLLSSLLTGRKIENVTNSHEF